MKMTVGNLRSALDGLPYDMPVVVDGTAEWDYDICSPGNGWEDNYLSEQSFVIETD